MTADDTMRWVQALVRLWDREQHGYTMQEVGAEAGWELVDYGANWTDSIVAPYELASVGAMSDGLVRTAWDDRDGKRRLVFTPVLG